VPRARLILTYHRVGRASDDPLELCVALERFREHLDVLRTLGEVVPLAALMRHGRGVRFAITFDDGYADNAQAAAPLLEAQGMPATVFVVAGSVGSHEPFWWDRLSTSIFSGAVGPKLELGLGGQALEVDTRTPAGRMRAYLAAWTRLRMLTPAQIEEALDRLEAGLRSGEARVDARPLGEEELLALAGGVVDIGAHTVSHPSLPTIAIERQREEISGSRAALERMIDRPVRAFAYPYGDYDATTPRLVREAGFRHACTVHEGRASRLSSRFLLPRVTIRDWTAEQLETVLRSWIPT
jgi:peptidoglycan/xylan/chitin deacetylase (PgdA/CDA1 family)